MIRSLVYATILQLFYLTGVSQQIISGIIQDAATGHPVSSASIYFNNTSIGTSSGEDGRFQLDASRLTIGDLIVSSVGYQTIAVKLVIEETPKMWYVFKLDLKEKTMQDVLVVSDEMRKAYLKKFISNFLGITEEAEKSTITNLKAVYFSANGNDRNSFFAFSDEPLEIINKKLGYKIYFQLIQFVFEGKNEASSFYGYTRYESMGDRKLWDKNRRAIYYGSTLHFFRSLINNTLNEEHYEVYFLQKDSIKSINSQPKIADRAIRATAGEIIKKDSSNLYYIASWPGWLMVQYLKEPATKRHLSLKTLVSGGMNVGFWSNLKTNSSPVVIDKYGILADPLSVYFSGYWIYEKAANLLPNNYYPDK
jgi:hypothetical protein